MKYFLICVWLFTVYPAVAETESRRVRLRAEVYVQTASVRLSDLLPDHAGAQLQTWAQGVSLGRAPQAGSLRVFNGSELRPVLSRIPAGQTAIDIPEQVVVRRLGWPLAGDRVRRALSQSEYAQRLDLSQARITIPPGFTTVTPDPTLEVASLTPGGQHGSYRAQMRCRQRAACQNFMVEIALNFSARGTPEPGQASRKFAPPALSSIGQVLVQPGRLALLVIVGDGLKITQPVMPSRRARLGELVRVSDPLTHRVMLAQVSGQGRLRLPDIGQNEEKR